MGKTVFNSENSIQELANFLHLLYEETESGGYRIRKYDLDDNMYKQIDTNKVKLIKECNNE